MRAPALKASWIDIAAAVLFAAVTFGYFHRALAAADNSLWFDEVLSVWTARMPDVAGVWRALERGSEFTPPLFDLLLHAIVRLGFDSPIAMRLPAIIGIYVAALAVGAFVRRRAGWPLAALAAAIVMTSGVFDYAVQARPYACLTAVTAIALLVWDGIPEQGRVGWRAFALGSLLTLAISLHFYAIVLVGLFGIGELCWSFANRRLRIPVLAAITIAGASMLLWLRLILIYRVFLAADRVGASYYGDPTLSLLGRSYLELSGELLLQLVVIVGAFFLLRRRAGTQEPSPPGDAKWFCAALILMAVPLAVFVFSAVVTHSYAVRYTLTFVLGMALMLAYVVNRLGERMSGAAAAASLAVLAIGSQVQQSFPAESPRRLAAIKMARLAPGAIPLATLNGGRFLELVDAAPDHRSNLILLRPPPGSADPTAVHQAERWAAMRSDLEVRTPAQMLAAHPCFPLLSDTSELFEDDITRALGASIRVQPQGDGMLKLYWIGKCSPEADLHPPIPS